ncbi:MAG TPA: LacI family DNA-binding transcriptional regulator [Puia sp.]|nr:LacI family DNA-binding transcriptional regulator [Puia sp.]
MFRIAKQTITPKLPNQITLANIASELNITPATVSRALRDHPKISSKTKKSVLKVADRLNYKRNKIASSLRSGKTHMIGVIVPSAEINFFGSVVHGIEGLANLNGYSVLIFQSNETHEHEVSGMETLIAARVDGILVSIAKDTIDHSHFVEAKQKGIPLVFFDRANDNIGIPSVVIDDFRGAFIATEHLIRQGYKKIAHVSGPQNIKVFSDRLKGYLAALQANNIKANSSLIYQGNVSIESGRKAAKYFLAKKVPPDAVFAAEDFTALGVVKEIKNHKIKIPEEFGVFGFANELFGEHISPTLSTIDQQTVLMGKEAFKLLLQFIEEKDIAVAIQKKIVLEPIPIFRESSSGKKNG